MTQDPRAENRRLRLQVDDFMAQARQNELKLRRFQALELRLIGLNSLFDLVETLLYPDPATFRWDLVTLLLLDPEYEIRRTLEEEGVDLERHPTLLFATDRDHLESYYTVSLFPTLGPFRARRHGALFPKPRRSPASVMLLPLVRHGRLIGSMNIGSREAHRFVRGVRTDFFEHLAAVAAICVENAINLERLKRQGLTDTLTAVNNRRFFDQRLGEEVESAKRDHRPLSCLLLDVDHFKQVNDSHGHQVGDQVLMEVAAVIRAQLRGSDVLARYGGEEFSALLPGTGDEKAGEVAERIRAAVAERCFRGAGDEPFGVTISIGIATFDPLQDPHARRMVGDYLVGQADRALYEAKAAGRDRVLRSGPVRMEEEWPMFA